MNKEELDTHIQAQFATLPPKLKVAARYALDAPKDVALKSMRLAAASAGLQPGAMLRLARELGFAQYEDFKAVYVHWLANQDADLVHRTRQLRDRSQRQGQEKALFAFVQAELLNLDKTLNADHEPAWLAAQQALSRADQIYVLGVRSLFSVAYYFHYVLATFRRGVTLVAGVGGATADELRRIGAGDVLVCFSAAPYSLVSVQAAQLAVERGASVIAVADSPVSPVVEQAAVTVLAPNTNLAVFPSVVPHMAVAHTLAQLMASRGGDEVLAEVANSEAQLKRFGVYTR